MNTEISNLLSEFQDISDNTQKTFGGLSVEQINWKPAAEVWSVGQCFEHLIKTNELFYTELGKIADGTRRNSFLENWSPLSGVFANLLISSLDNPKKLKMNVLH